MSTTIDYQTLNDKQLLRKLKARRRFRNIIKQVIRNRYWLLDSSEMQLGDNVRQNVTLIYSGKKKAKPTLSLEHKCLLRKKAEWRTDEEKRTLYKSIGDLKCFRSWPDHVKFKLVSCTYFIYFDAGRTIVRQNKIAEALYFIISGEVSVIQENYDEVLGVWTSMSVGKLGAGSMFGEVSLIKKIPRTATIQSLTPCELILVDREDFDDTLRSTLKEQWDEIKEGLSSFPYFQDLSENAQTECCMLSKIINYMPNEIVYGGSSKHTGCAYFILKGTCNVIELMYIEEKMVKGQKVYNLFQGGNFKKSHHSITSLSIESTTGTLGSVHTPIVSFVGHVDARKEEIRREIYEKCPTVRGMLNNFGRCHKISPVGIKNDTFNLIIPRHVEPHILQICQFTEKSCFFENDILQNRKVVSCGPVKCLLIPVYWLQLNNTGNIWNRIVVFMANHIPNTEKAFAKYVENVKWIQYRHKICSDVLAQHSYPNDTGLFDVPYSLRIGDKC